MKLGISLPGSPWLGTVDGWDENRDWLIKHCDVVGLPMPKWANLQPTADAKYDHSVLTGLDRVVDEARAAGLQIFMFPERAPAWTTAQHAARAGSANVTPDDLSPAGPWAHYIRFVLAHFRGRVSWVAPFNEPNWEYVGDPDTYIADCVTMTKTAAEMAAGIRGAPMLLVPNVLDSEVKGWSRWSYWLPEFLKGLQGYQPPPGVRLGCGFHPYEDLAEGRPLPVAQLMGLPIHGLDMQPRVQGALDMLVRYPTCLGQKIYLTELGTTFAANPVAHGSTLYDYSNYAADDVRQRDHLARGYSWAMGRMEPKIRGEVVMAQQWVFRDRLQGHWKSGLLSPDGTPHSIISYWEARTK